MFTITESDVQAFQIWEAWLDGQRDNAVTFTVSTGGSVDVAEAGAEALGVDVCSELNVRSISL